MARLEKQLQDVQRDDVPFIKQKILSGVELNVFYTALNVTNQRPPSGQYPFYVFPQVSLGEAVKTSSPIKWHHENAYRAVNSKRCDLQVANERGYPVEVFEYQGGGHYIDPGANMRDRIKRIALERSGICYVKIKAGVSRSEICQ